MQDVAERRWVQGRKQPRTVTIAITVAYDAAELERAEGVAQLQPDDLADLRLSQQESVTEWFRGTVGIRCVAEVEEPTDEAEGGEGDDRSAVRDNHR